MNFNNPLEPVYKAFAVANDCFKVVTRAIQDQREELIRRTQFVGATPEVANIALEDAAKQAADLAILALFATFDRFVIEHLQTSNRLLAAGYPQHYANRLAAKFESEVEYWRFGEILSLFKGEVDADLIGRIKQIKQYRDWIAHQNPSKTTPMQVSPETAFDVLTQMIEQIRTTHAPPSDAEAEVESVDTVAPA
jgi:hypothetical protein